MRKGLWVVLLLLPAACKSNDLDLLERERAKFKAENEAIRAEDLEARYRKEKRKADRLSDELLLLGRERDRLYGEYDHLQGEITRLGRDTQSATQRKQQVQKALEQLRAETKKLQEQLAAEKKSVEDLERQLQEERKKRAALEVKARDGANPG